jgi:hypothetical protein
MKVYYVKVSGDPSIVIGTYNNKKAAIAHAASIVKEAEDEDYVVVCATEVRTRFAKNYGEARSEQVYIKVL